MEGSVRVYRVLGCRNTIPNANKGESHGKTNGKRNGSYYYVGFRVYLENQLA